MISVVIPSYNGAETLFQAIDSVLCQTTKTPLEILVIDDNSTDDTLEKMGRYGENDRVRYIRNETNKGASASRNRGVQLAKGDYIAFLDADDYWDPEKLEEQEKALTNLFTGIRAKEVSDYEVTIVPFDNLDKEVLFRFSPQLGIVDADDLGGAPVYMNLKAIDRAPVLDPKEAEKKEKSLKGIIYNVPGKASIEISMNKKTLYKGEAQITQFGTREGLAPIMFEDKKAPVKVYFYPETGAIKQIIQ